MNRLSITHFRAFVKGNIMPKQKKDHPWKRALQDTADMDVLPTQEDLDVLPIQSDEAVMAEETYMVEDSYD